MEVSEIFNPHPEFQTNAAGTIRTMGKCFDTAHLFYDKLNQYASERMASPAIVNQYNAAVLEHHKAQVRLQSANSLLSRATTHAQEKWLTVGRWRGNLAAGPYERGQA